jgi:hypothetical protein
VQAINIHSLHQSHATPKASAAAWILLTLVDSMNLSGYSMQHELCAEISNVLREIIPKHNINGMWDTKSWLLSLACEKANTKNTSQLCSIASQLLCSEVLNDQIIGMSTFLFCTFLLGITGASLICNMLTTQNQLSEGHALDYTPLSILLQTWLSLHCFNSFGENHSLSDSEPAISFHFTILAYYCKQLPQVRFV